MPVSGPRRGRRDNGLVAAEYAVVGDVDPRVGEHLLDVLASSGIAAYLQPASDLHPVTRTTTLPARPTDRLFADREHLSTAKGYLELLAEEQRQAEAASAGTASGDYPRPAAGDGSSADPGFPGADEIDAVFASIIASYDVPVDPEARSWPLSEELPTEDRHPGRRRTDRPQPPPAGPTTGTPTRPDSSDGRQPPSARPEYQPRTDPEASLLDGLDSFGAELPDPEEGYDPPPPPPLPRLSRATTAAILAIVVGMVVFFWPSLLPMGQNAALLFGFGAVFGGFVTLVLRMRSGEDDEDDPDDGARV